MDRVGTNREKGRRRKREESIKRKRRRRRRVKLWKIYFLRIREEICLIRVLEKKDRGRVTRTSKRN